MSAEVWTIFLVACSFALYLYIGWRSRVKDSSGFYVARQDIPQIANGAATAADWMSAASFISMAGLISILGYDGSIYLMGWTGGYVLLALLLAPYLRKFGKYTVPDFVGDRYYSNVARLVAVVAALFISLTYVAGQMRGVGIVFSRFGASRYQYGRDYRHGGGGVLLSFGRNERYYLDAGSPVCCIDCGLSDSNCGDRLSSHWQSYPTTCFYF